MYLVGRRGPAQAAFTAKELREVLREFIDLAVCLRLLVPVPLTFIHHVICLTSLCKIIRAETVIDLLNETYVASGIKDLSIEIRQEDLSKTPADEVWLPSVLLYQAL